MIKYGKSFRKDHLYYEGDFIPVNNGSCGTIPKKILELLESVNRKMFANPDYWMIFKQFS